MCMCTLYSLIQNYILRGIISQTNEVSVTESDTIYNIVSTKTWIVLRLCTVKTFGEIN